MTSSVASWYQGTTHNITTTVKNLPGEIVDVTGATARFAMRHVLSTDLVATKTHDDGITLGGQTGKVTVAVNPADTESLTPGDYQAQCEVTLLDGTVFLAYDLVITIKKNSARLVV